MAPKSYIVRVSEWGQVQELRFTAEDKLLGDIEDSKIYFKG